MTSIFIVGLTGSSVSVSSSIRRLLCLLGRRRAASTSSGATLERTDVDADHDDSLVNLLCLDPPSFPCRLCPKANLSSSELLPRVSRSCSRPRVGVIGGGDGGKVRKGGCGCGCADG